MRDQGKWVQLYLVEITWLWSCKRQDPQTFMGRCMSLGTWARQNLKQTLTFMLDILRTGPGRARLGTEKCSALMVKFKGTPILQLMGEHGVVNKIWPGSHRTNKYVGKIKTPVMTSFCLHNGSNGYLSPSPSIGWLRQVEGPWGAQSSRQGWWFLVAHRPASKLHNGIKPNLPPTTLHRFS